MLVVEWSWDKTPKNWESQSWHYPRPRAQAYLSTLPLSSPTNDSPDGRMNRPDTSYNLKADSEQSKVHRPKAPVDIEKQCSVTLASGNQCARSLTCTRHGMSAKRAVPGRSNPFDQLLAEYQRESSVKLPSTFHSSLLWCIANLLLKTSCRNQQTSRMAELPHGHD